MQRFFDIIFALSGVLLLSPLLLCVCVILRLTGEGEIFYAQERVGRGGRIFNILKFATMLKDSPNIGTGTVTIMNDPRVLPFGRLLRRSKINELPQLLNVIRGDMSLIGPRPQTKRCFLAFPENLRDEIVSVRPGLSGLGSIVFRHEEKMLQDDRNADDLYDLVIMPYKGELEVWYARHNTIWLYFYLMILTLLAVILGKTLINKRLWTSIPKVPDELSNYL